MVISVTKTSQALCMVSDLPIPNNYFSFCTRCEHSNVPFNLYSITIPCTQQLPTRSIGQMLPSFLHSHHHNLYVCTSSGHPVS